MARILRPIAGSLKMGITDLEESGSLFVWIFLVVCWRIWGQVLAAREVGKGPQSISLCRRPHESVIVIVYSTSMDGT